uniref:Profilin n=2 Tax=Schistocephalus solidus TaxID=70667 RepID=A0A0X3PX62_SCHSO
MSWDDTLRSLTNYSGVTSGCIAGLDGSIWASTPDFKPTADEIKKIVDCAKNGKNENLTAQGNSMRCIRSGDNNVSALGNTHAMDVALTNKAVVIAANNAPSNTPGVNRLLCVASSNIAAYLSKSGY